MRIAFVIDQLDIGGAEQQLVTLAQGLRRRRHDVHVISIHDRGELRGELENADVRVTIAHKYSKFDITTAWRLRGLIRSIDPELVHAYLPTASSLTPLSRWMGVSAPVLQSERGINDWRSSGRIYLENVVRSSVAHITCNAAAIKQHLVAVEGVSPDKISVIYNGLRAERRSMPDARAIDDARRRIAAAPDAAIVTCVANFSPVKQHHVLLEAFAIARQAMPRMHLVLVGRGALESDIRSRMNALGLSAACTIITDSTNPRPILAVSNVATLTSQLEGCSNALLEAMALGLPVVASDTGGNPELVAHGLGGYVCPVGDAQSVSDALVSVVSDVGAAQVMGRYNRERVEREFTDDVMVERSLGLYETLIGGSTASRPSGRDRSSTSNRLH
jgi:glycosyltransferase involved in cell wall biosynthesis